MKNQARRPVETESDIVAAQNGLLDMAEQACRLVVDWGLSAPLAARLSPLLAQPEPKARPAHEVIPMDRRLELVNYLAACRSLERRHGLTPAERAMLTATKLALHDELEATP